MGRCYQRDYRQEMIMWSFLMMLKEGLKCILLGIFILIVVYVTGWMVVAILELQRMMVYGVWI